MDYPTYTSLEHLTGERLSDQAAYSSAIYALQSYMAELGLSPSEVEEKVDDFFNHIAVAAKCYVDEMLEEEGQQ